MTTPARPYDSFGAWLRYERLVPSRPFTWAGITREHLKVAKRPLSEREFRWHLTDPVSKATDDAGA